MSMISLKSEEIAELNRFPSRRCGVAYRDALSAEPHLWTLMTVAATSVPLLTKENDKIDSVSTVYTASKMDSSIRGQSHWRAKRVTLQKGGVPAAPSGTATLLRLSPSHLSYPWPLLSVTDFRHSRLPWLDGRCVQGPGTYSPRHG